MQNQDQFDKWVDMWAKAQTDGVFEDMPKPACPSANTGASSYFGVVSSNPTEAPTDFDAKYWSQVYNMSNGEEGPLSDGPGIISEDKNTNKYPANPVLGSGWGMDQDMSNKASLGLTFDEADLKKLENMKVQLHELGDKLATSMGKGDKFQKFESKITSLSKQIDELSSSMTRPYLAK
jgi:hypothetical protein